jgi:hypothetical protein
MLEHISEDSKRNKTDDENDFNHLSGLPFLAYLMETIANSPSFESVDLYLGRAISFLNNTDENISKIAARDYVQNALNSIIAAKNQLSSIRHGSNQTFEKANNEDNNQYCTEKLTGNNSSNIKSNNKLDVLNAGEKAILGHLNNTRNAIINNNATKVYGELYQADVSFILMLQCLSFYLR